MTPELQPAAQFVSWKVGRQGFGSVHFLHVGESVTHCGKEPSGVIDWEPPFTADTVCRQCAMLYKRHLKVVR